MITWKINQLDHNTADGFVTTAHWTCSSVDGEFSGSVYSSCGFDGELSIPYEQLTEEEVLSWVWEKVDKQVTETAVLAQIESKKNPVSVVGLPWSE